MNKILQLSSSIALIFGLFASSGWSQITTFDYTGGMQTYVVPTGVTLMHMELYGASGHGNLGYGGKVEAVLEVTPGETLNIFVGGAGGGTTGGYNGGGVPGSSSSYGGGGGASDVRQGGAALADRIIVAGGGGGSGSNCGLWSAEGGHGGGLTGESGCLYSCSDCQYTGAGGSQVAGGIAGPTGHIYCGDNNNGALGVGGSNSGSSGTGGGGGYYGGGSGCYEGAGGGSSYTHPDATDVVHTVGVQDGNGQVILTVLCTALTTEVSAEELCEGEELTLSASSETGGSVEWDMDVIDGEAFEPPVGTTVYTAISDSDDDCNFEVEILVHASPEVTASVDEDEVCEGEAFIFTGGGATTYEWDMDVEDGEEFVAEPGTATYTVTGTDDNGCEATAEVEATVHALPEVTANVDDDEVCDGDSFVFTGGGATSYEWDMGVTDGEEIIEPVGSETYTVTGTDDNGCVNTATVDATVHALPEVSASASAEEACFGSEVTFNGDGATSYEWDMGVTDGDPAEMEESGTVTFTVTGTDDNGCENTATVDVEVSDEIVITYTTGDEILGDDGSIDISVSGGVPAYSFDWDNDETGDFDDDEDLTDLAAGTYTVVVQDDEDCSSEEAIVVNSQVGLTSESKTLLSVYPNPTNGQFNIEFSGDFKYTITDISGAILVNGNATDKETLSLEGFANGLYLITVKTNNHTRTVRIVKN